MKLDTFKKHLDKWLKGIPDTPKIDDYGVAVGAETNSITKQKENIWWPYLWGSHVSTGDKIHNNNNNNNFFVGVLGIVL